MLKYSHVATLVYSKADYTENVTDMVIVEAASGPVLVTTANIGESVIYRLTGVSSPAESVMRVRPLQLDGYFSPPRLEVIERGGLNLVISTGTKGSASRGFEITNDGRARSDVQVFTDAPLPDDVVAMAQYKIGGQTYLLSGRDKQTSLSLYHLDADARATRISDSASLGGLAADAEYTDLEVVSVDGRIFAYAASSQGNALAIFAADASSLTLIGSVDGGNRIGIAAPREVEAVTTAHGSFLIVTGAQSDSITVMKINSSGGLSLADHVIDSGTTRFQSVTAIATVEMDGRVFIFVGGSDDGISVMTLDGHGRLILLTTIEDTLALALADVSAIEAKVIGSQIALFVSSATETGITQLSFDPGVIGASKIGSGQQNGTTGNDILVGAGSSSTLVGGGGDDILIARDGVVQLYGGTGSDVFIPAYSAEHVLIRDFDPRTDRLDLSEMAYVRSLSQLKIIPTATGALLSAGPLKIEIFTVNGNFLAPSFFNEEMFRLAHYAQDIDYSDLVEPVIPDPGTPSPPNVGPGTFGGYTPPAPLPPVSPITHRKYGTGGNDRMVALKTGSYLNGLGGNDRFQGGGQQDIIFGGNGNDRLDGAGGSDHLNGGAGTDTLLGQAGHDWIYGGAGRSFITGGSGDDRIWGHNDADVIDGGLGNDVIRGSGGNDLLRGDQGNDLIFSGLGRDTLVGGTGNDRLYGHGINTRVYGGEGNDHIGVKGSGNAIFGDSGNDTVVGGSGTDFISLGTGNDVADGRAGNDVIDGRAGNDTINGSDGHDRLIGHIGNDRIRGGRGSDTGIGGDGDDTITGDSGDDTLTGDRGRDFVDGGLGNDVIRGGDDGDKLYGSDGNDDVAGNNGRDTISGGNGNDRLSGGLGNDTIDGGHGTDRINGDAGDDRLVGGGANDALDGGTGNDTLLGGDGSDHLTGGSGADVFVFAAPSSGQYGTTDRVRDFDSGVDVIDLTELPGTLVWMEEAGFSGSGWVEVRMVRITGGQQLQVDLNGDRTTDFRIDVFGDMIGPFDLLF